jgi:hypothetical protein
MFALCHKFWEDGLRRIDRLSRHFNVYYRLTHPTIIDQFFAHHNPMRADLFFQSQGRLTLRAKVQFIACEFALTRSRTLSIGLRKCHFN